MIFKSKTSKSCVLFLAYYPLFENIIFIWGMTMKRIMLNTKENIKTIENAFEEFQQFNKIKDLSEHTISNYERTYKIFTEFYSEQNLCNNLDVQVINEFIGYIKENRKISNISVNSYLRNIRAFVNYCIKIGYVEKSFKIPILKAEKR